MNIGNIVNIFDFPSYFVIINYDLTGDIASLYLNFVSDEFHYKHLLDQRYEEELETIARKEMTYCTLFEGELAVAYYSREAESVIIYKFKGFELISERYIPFDYVVQICYFDGYILETCPYKFKKYSRILDLETNETEIRKGIIYSSLRQTNILNPCYYSRFHKGNVYVYFKDKLLKILENCDFVDFTGESTILVMFEGHRYKEINLEDFSEKEFDYPVWSDKYGRSYDIVDRFLEYDNKKIKIYFNTFFSAEDDESQLHRNIYTTKKLILFWKGDYFKMLLR